MFYSILLGGFGGISYLCKDFPLKKIWKIFGGKEKSIYLCNRKRETNAPHDEASGSLGSE
jgi:hypothetical protein